MPNAQACYVPGLGHGWLARRMDLHLSMVEAWLSGGELPGELVAEVASPAVVARLRRELGDDSAGVWDVTAPRLQPEGRRFR